MKNSVLALLTVTALTLPLAGCGSAEQTKNWGQLQATRNFDNRGHVNYSTRPDIAERVMNTVPGIASAVVLVRDNTAYVAVNEATVRRNAGDLNRRGGSDYHTRGALTQGGYAYSKLGGYAPGAGGPASGGVTGRGHAPGAGVAGGGPAPDAGGPMASGGGYAPGAGGPTASGGVTGGGTGTTGGGTTGGGTTGSGPTGAGTTGGGGGTPPTPGDLSVDMKQKIEQAVKQADHSIRAVYASNSPLLMSRFTAFNNNRIAVRTRAGVNDLADVIRRVFPTAR